MRFGSGLIVAAPDKRVLCALAQIDSVKRLDWGGYAETLNESPSGCNPASEGSKTPTTETVMRLANRVTRHALIVAATMLTAAASASDATAQGFDVHAYAMQELNASNANIQRQVDALIGQQMQNPRVQASYQQYLARQRAHGQPAMDFPTFTYRFTYTAEFSPEGIRRAAEVDRLNAAKIAAAQAGVREAQRNYGDAIRDRSESYSRIQGKSGLALRGESTYYAPNGASVALPHTWPVNSMHQHGGNTYRVDASGQYQVYGSDGWWHPLSSR